MHRSTYEQGYAVSVRKLAQELGLATEYRRLLSNLGEADVMAFLTDPIAFCAKLPPKERSSPFGVDMCQMGKAFKTALTVFGRVVYPDDDVVFIGNFDMAVGEFYYIYEHSALFLPQHTDLGKNLLRTLNAFPNLNLWYRFGTP